MRRRAAGAIVGLAVIASCSASFAQESQSAAPQGAEANTMLNKLKNSGYSF